MCFIIKHWINVFVDVDWGWVGYELEKGKRKEKKRSSNSCEIEEFVDDGQLMLDRCNNFVKNHGFWNNFILKLRFTLLFGKRPKKGFS